MSVDIRIPSLVPELGFTGSENLRQAVPVASREGISAFDSFLQSAMGVINETSYTQLQSDIAQVNFATGQTNDMLDVILAQRRADSTLNFTVQVTNRIIEAYREIMRMQV